MTQKPPSPSNLSDSWERHVRLSRADLALFTRQLATMLGAGVGLRKSLEVLREGAVSESHGVVTERLLKQIESGWNLSRSMATFPYIFGKVYLAMIAVGEETGQLVGTLNNLADWLDSEENLVRQVRGAMTYPILVLSAALLLTIGFFVVIFPSFSQSLSTVDNLPLLTSSLILISGTLRQPLFWLLSFAGLAIGLQLVRQGLQRPENRLAVWKILAEVPILKLLLRDLGASRFSSAMAILLHTGVDILKSFRLASVASGNPLVYCRVEEGLQFIGDGGDLAAYMRQYPEVFPAMMTSLVMVGQEAAKLPEIFEKLQISFSEETEYRLHILTALLEPILMTMVAVLVGTLVIGVAMPMYGLINAVM